MAYFIQLLKPALPLLCSMLCSCSREDGFLLLQIMFPLSLAGMQRLLQYLQMVDVSAMILKRYDCIIQQDEVYCTLPTVKVDLVKSRGQEDEACR